MSGLRTPPVSGCLGTQLSSCRGPFGLLYCDAVHESFWNALDDFWTVIIQAESP